MLNEHDYIEFSHEDLSVDMGLLLSPEEHQERFHSRLKQHQCSEKETSKRGEKLRVILVTLALITLLYSGKVWMTLINDNGASTSTTDETVFTFSPEPALRAAHSVLERNLKPFSYKETSPEVTALFYSLYPEHTTFHADPQLIIETFPNHYLLYNSSSHPLVIIEENGRHVVDMEASIGYNNLVKGEPIKEASKYVRVILEKPLAEHSDSLSGCLSVSLPHETSSFPLYYEKDTLTGLQLERALKLGTNLRYTVHISPHNPAGIKRLFISHICNPSWVYSIPPTVDMKTFKPKF